MIPKQLSTLSLALVKLRTHVVIAIYGYERRIFDWYSGASTAGLTHTQLDTYNADTENWPHLGCQWPALSLVLKDLPREGTFVDLGSGKGKALLIAGMLAYRRVVGVEIDSELAGEARRNVENFRQGSGPG
jgi:SAM-dependent methyltransferase